MKTINGKNYFNEKSLKEMVEQLENGETIGIYIDCIGHTRSEYETSVYIEELQNHFGDRLIIDSKTHHIPTCKLKGSELK
jgi:hypothetical protein